MKPFNSRLATLAALFLLSGLVAVPAHAQAQTGQSERPTLRAMRLSQPPTLDGHLDEPVWQEAAVTESFTQLTPDEGEPVSERTEVRLGYDAENLYLGARCWDRDAGRIVANIATRDGDMTYDDTLQIVLDTFRDRQSGFLFMVNPLGAQFDATVRREGEEINADWDGLWQSVTHQDDAGWTLEMAIPFKTLRFPKAGEQTWGMNIGRFIARKREESFWTPMRRASGFYAKYKISRYGELTGLEAIEQAGRYQITPYVIVGHEEFFDTSDELLDAGLDVKAQLTSNLVADLTYNTDFAETEADDQQVNLTRFKLFFPEKRAFFLEGADLFYFGERPEPYRGPAESIFFFSRQIGLTEDGRQEIPVTGGAKITGKVGDVGLGFLNITTERETYRDELGRVLIEPETNYSVLRLKRDVFENSTVGLMGLHKEVSAGIDNSGYGVDWDFTLRENLETGGFLARTRTDGLDSDDWAGYADVFWDSRKLRARLAYTDIGESFNPAMGFFTRTGVQKLHTHLARIFWPESETVNRWFIVHYLDYITDQEGDLETRISNLELSVFYESSAGIAIKYFDQLEVLDFPFQIYPGVVIPPGSYNFDYGFFGFQTDYSKPLGGAGRLQVGEFYDGDLVQLFGAVVYRPIEGLITILVWERNDVDLPAGDFVTELSTFEIDYSPRTSLNLRLALQRNRDDNFRGKLILKWNYRPGSDLFLVYDETEDLRDPRLLPPGGSTLDERKILAKMTYRFDF